MFYDLGNNGLFRWSHGMRSSISTSLSLPINLTFTQYLPLGDTTGMATPRRVHELLDALERAGQAEALGAAHSPRLLKDLAIGRRAAPDVSQLGAARSTPKPEGGELLEVHLDHGKHRR